MVWYVFVPMTFVCMHPSERVMKSTLNKVSNKLLYRKALAQMWFYFFESISDSPQTSWPAFLVNLLVILQIVENHYRP